MIAPLAVHAWVLWSIASWSAYQYFKINSGLFIVVLGGFCAAHVKFLWSGWESHKEQKTALTDPLKNLSVTVGLLLSLASAISAIYLIMSVTSGFWWDAYFPIVTGMISLAICAAWRYRLNTVAFIWASALGGYVGRLVATYHDDWQMLEATVRIGHYDVALGMLMLPEYFIFAVGGALAALLMFGLSRVFFAMRAPKHA